MKRVLFICLGNICRSPAAEAVFRKKVEAKGWGDRFEIDSAGTGGYHTGEPSDERMIAHGLKRGYELTSRARKVYPDQDFEKFDLLVTMDDSNYSNVKALENNDELAGKLHKFVSYCQNPVKEVPDPYYGGEQGFETVYDILEDGCEGLLASFED